MGMDPAIRPMVTDALINRPRVQGRWFGDGGSGCFWVIAAQRVTGISRRMLQRDPAEQTAQIFGVSEERVEAVYNEWDDLPPERLEMFIENLRQQVAADVAAGRQTPRRSIRERAQTAFRELVTA